MTTAVQTKETWRPKIEAAEFLKVSVRTLEKISRSGVIRRKYLPRQPNERQARVVFSAEDLKAYRDKAQGPAVDPVTKQPNGLVPMKLSPSIAEMSGFMGNLLMTSKEFAESLRPREARAWLTFAEAVEYSGLTPAMVQKAVRDGDVTALGKGRVTWRISRASLDEYGKAGA